MGLTSDPKSIAEGQFQRLQVSVTALHCVRPWVSSFMMLTYRRQINLNSL